MPEPRDARSIIEQAQQAAAAGEFTSAEQLLREAALLQEASLGPLDPDLANTLNNLGVLCERTGKQVDAEACFRRACEIAVKALAPDHPFVTTSRQNLREFCEAHGKPVDVVTSLPVESQALKPASKPTLAPLAIGASTAGLLLIALLATARPWFGTTDGAASPAEIARPAVQEVHATSSVIIERRADAARINLVGVTPTADRPTVVKARLCAELVNWQCDPPDFPVPPGPLFFYTQAKSNRPTTMTHRWYQDDRLFQSIDIRVQAGRGGGFRSFSRQTMTATNRGAWRVELRAEDGTVLHETRFSAR